MSDYNVLFISNYTRLATQKIWKRTFIFCKTQVRLLSSLSVLKFLYDYIETKAWLSFPNAKRFVIYSKLALDQLYFLSIDDIFLALIREALCYYAWYIIVLKAFLETWSTLARVLQSTLFPVNKAFFFHKQSVKSLKDVHGINHIFGLQLQTKYMCFGD